MLETMLSVNIFLILVFKVLKVILNNINLALPEHYSNSYKIFSLILYKCHTNVLMLL